MSRERSLRRYVVGFVAVVIIMPLIPMTVGLLRAFDAMPVEEVHEIADSADRGLAALRELNAAVAGDPARAAGGVRSEIDVLSESLQSISSTAARFAVFERQTAVSLLVAGLLGTASAVLLGVALWFVTLRRFVRPLRVLARGIERVRSEDDPGTLQAHGHPQMRFILDSFNDMLATIAAQAERIRTAEREGVSRFLVHQFRNSLTPIGLGSQNLEQLLAGTVEGSRRQVADQALAMINAQTERMKRLIDEFASLTRFPEPRLSGVDLRTLAERVVAGLPVRGEDVSVEVEVPEALRVSADPTMLEHMLLNLVENAVDALPDGVGSVKIVAVEPGILEIRDSGKGMAPEVAAQIFSEHFTTKRRGMGLGMSFVKRVCDAHGFTVDVESAPEAGTTVRIDLSAGLQRMDERWDG
jgi:nitrogen fixation/metabolism regulation signal transduction histidine kinase